MREIRGVSFLKLLENVWRRRWRTQRSRTVILLEAMKLGLFSGRTSRVTAGRVCSRPVEGLHAKTPFHLDLAPALAHCWSVQVFFADLLRPLFSIHLALSPSPPPLPSHLSFQHVSSRSLTLFPPTTPSINTSHYLCALRKDQRVSGIISTLWAAAAIQVENEHICAHTYTSTITRNTQKQKVPATT